MKNLKLSIVKDIAKPHDPILDSDQNPEKRFFKSICRLIFICGFGSCWYESGERSFTISPKLYRIWSFICHIYCISVIVSEFLAHCRSDLTLKERNDAVQFNIGHPTIYIKCIVFTLKRSKIKIFLKNLIEDLRIPDKFEREAVKKSKFFIFVLTSTVFVCLSMATVDALVTQYREGVPTGALVPYWPGKESKGIFPEIARFFVQFFWWYIITVMLALDSLCLTSLISLSFRFKTLQEYFEGLRIIFEDNVKEKTVSELEQELKRGFIGGIKLHSKTLWWSRSLQRSMGILYSSQVVQSIGLLAILLIKLVSLERNFPFMVANVSFMFSMTTLTGCYMMAGGDITYEASCVSTSMFHCGWDLCRASLRMRPLVVVAVQCSNRPLIMTAFGIFDLSYTNFISVLRISYSFFAVMY